MPDIDAFNIINIYIHSIGTEETGHGELLHKQACCPERTHEAGNNRAEKCYISTDSISKSNNKDKLMVNNQLSNTIDYSFQD